MDRRPRLLIPSAYEDERSQNGRMQSYDCGQLSVISIVLFEQVLTFAFVLIICLFFHMFMVLNEDVSIDL